MAGGAVITEKPQNVTAEEGQALEMPCKGHANPGNISVMWYRHVVDGSNGGGSHEQRITSTPRLKVSRDVSDSGLRALLIQIGVPAYLVYFLSKKKLTV